MINLNCNKPECCYGQQVTAAAATFALALSKCLTPNEQNIIGNFFIVAGDSILSIAALNDICCPNEEDIPPVIE